MAHKFQPADDKYWAEQKIKRQQALLRYQIATAPKTTFSELFVEEADETLDPSHQDKSKRHTEHD
jgi:hypothetical protein